MFKERAFLADKWLRLPAVDLPSSFSSEAITRPSRKRAETAQGKKIRLMLEGGEVSEQKVSAPKVSASVHRTESPRL